VTRWSLRRHPAPVVDTGLAVLLAVAIVVAIQVAPPQGKEPDAFAYGCGLAVAAASLFRRRWPVPVLLVSAGLFQLYNLSDYPGLHPAVPMSVSLATAWAAGHRGWALGLTAWFVLGPVGFTVWLAATTDEPVRPLVEGNLQDVAMFAAVLLLGEAIRGRRALDREHRLLVAEQERSERLLLNILPAPVADRLKRDEQQVIADGFAEVTVLFADLVEFTRHSQQVTPEQVVAGVIGREKFSYDLWGDTVNTASRMESQGVPGCIQVTDRTYRRLRGRYRFDRRGPVQVKGKGKLVTWFLVGRDGQAG
jgi:Adenylate and Guanylate cyclase catalytic domain